MTAPTVTILTATYNQAQYIDRCVRSVLDQTFANWQLVVVDDGSSDETVAKVRSYGDSRIEIVEAPHRGIEMLYQTYAMGLAKSNAEFVAILDGDDFWPKDKLERQLPLFADHRVAMTYGSVYLVDSAGKIGARRGLPRFATGRVDGPSLALRILVDGYFPYSVTSMVRRSVLDSCGGFFQPTNLPLVDVPTWLNVLLNGDACGTDHMLGFYRVHSSSVTRTRTAQVVHWQQIYNESFLENNRDRLGLSGAKFARTAAHVRGYHSYVRAVVALGQARYKDARRELLICLREASLSRRAKALVRLAQGLRNLTD